MKTIHTYVCLVDNYRRPSRRRNTAGRYLVGAKSEKEAKDLLQDAIGVGSVQVYYRATDATGHIQDDNSIDAQMRYKEIKKVIFTAPDTPDREYQPPRHATDPY